MSLLSQITCGKRPAPRRCMIHGVQGVGKSTWAATSDRPIFIQTEDGLGEIDCAKFPVARGFADVMAALTELRSEAHDFRTVVVDSLDWLERLIWQEVCVRKNVKNIEDIEPYRGPHAIEGIRFRAAREALGVSAWGMNVLELDPGCDGYPEHDHEADGQEEVYAVLRGEVILQAAGEERLLKPGDMVRVAPSVRRKLVTRAHGATILALGATPGRAFVPQM